MEQKTLIVYSSKGGATERYARIIGAELGHRGHEVAFVDLGRVRKPDLRPYDNVVLGTGVRMSRVYRRGRRLLKRKELAEKRLAIFLSSGIAVEDPEKSKAKFLEPLIERYGLTPVLCDPLPGMIPGEGSELQDRTDPELAREWARRLAERLEPPSAET